MAWTFCIPAHAPLFLAKCDFLICKSDYETSCGRIPVVSAFGRLMQTGQCRVVEGCVGCMVSSRVAGDRDLGSNPSTGSGPDLTIRGFVLSLVLEIEIRSFVLSYIPDNTPHPHPFFKCLETGSHCVVQTALEFFQA